MVSFASLKKSFLYGYNLKELFESRMPFCVAPSCSSGLPRDEKRRMFLSYVTSKPTAPLSDHQNGA